MAGKIVCAIAHTKQVKHNLLQIFRAVVLNIAVVPLAFDSVFVHQSELYKNIVHILTQKKGLASMRKSSVTRIMGYKTLEHKQQARFKDEQGNTVPTTVIRVPFYLAKEVRAIAEEIHQARVAEGTVPTNN